MMRKHTDISETRLFFHQFAKAGKVYIIANDLVWCGVNIALDQFKESILAAIHQKNTALTSADGLRLGCIMLDPKYQDSISGIMSKKKNHTKSDIPGDHVTNFFETILTECFSNPSYEAVPPPQEYYSQFPEEERKTWNPNSASVFKHEHWMTSRYLGELFKTQI
jgi:hypothetical protein